MAKILNVHIVQCTRLSRVYDLSFSVFIQAVPIVPLKIGLIRILFILLFRPSVENTLSKISLYILNGMNGCAEQMLILFSLLFSASTVQ